MYKILTIVSLVAILGSCTFTEKIKDGSTAYDRKQYAVAVDMLQKDFNKTKSRVEKGKIAYKIGDSYKKMNQNAASIDWFQKAFDNQFGPDALKDYAFALKQEQRYDEAMEAFKNLGVEIGSPYEYRKEITACTQAKDWLGQEKYTGYTVAPAAFNSSSADYGPTIYKDNQLVFTSDRSASTGDEIYMWTGKQFSDLYLVDLNTKSAQPFNDVINSPNNEGTVTFSEDFSEIYFTRCFSEENRNDHYCQIMMSTNNGNNWSEPTPLNFIEENVNYGHPSLSKDGSTLYFSCNHPDGWGGYDIYTAEKTPSGFDAPKLLGRNINTIGDEKFPFIDKDTLYFSSNYHANMGGLDIFKTYKMDAENWAPVHNLKAPINSGGDDFGFSIHYEAVQNEPDLIQKGFFSSSRVEGNDDIYGYERRTPIDPPQPEIKEPVEPDTPKVEDTPKPIVYKIILEGYVLEKIYSSPGNPNSKVLGRKPLPGSNVQVNFNGKKETFKVDEDGKFTMELEENTDFRFFASKPEYLSNDEKFSTRGFGKDPKNPVSKYEIEIILDKIFKNKEITLDDIYYDYDKFDIRKDAEPTLNELVKILQSNPSIKIRLGSHTDCRGNAKYNEDLSQKRAQSAVQYLITKGIAAERLSAVGFGENALAINCDCNNCSEDEHQINRRTTFAIVD